VDKGTSLLRKRRKLSEPEDEVGEKGGRTLEGGLTVRGKRETLERETGGVALTEGPTCFGE